MMYEVVYGTSNEVGGDDGGGRWSARTVSFGDPCTLQGHSLPVPAQDRVSESVAPVESRLRSLRIWGIGMWIWIWICCKRSAFQDKSDES